MLLVLLGASVALASSEPASEPQPPGAPQFAILESITGAPGDSLAQRRFHDVVRGVFLERTFATERETRPGRYEVSIPINNRFVLLEGSGGPTDPPAYRVQLSLEWLPAGPGTPAKSSTKNSTAATKPRRRRAPW